jgi:hypothetical protein
MGPCRSCDVHVTFCSWRRVSRSLDKSDTLPIGWALSGHPVGAATCSGPRAGTRTFLAEARTIALPRPTQKVRPRHSIRRPTNALAQHTSTSIVLRISRGACHQLSDFGRRRHSDPIAPPICTTHENTKSNPVTRSGTNIRPSPETAIGSRSGSPKKPSG